jgi:estrogen-related receptor beta like 1
MLKVDPDQRFDAD